MSLSIKKLAARHAAILIAVVLTVCPTYQSPKPGDKGSNSTSNSIDNGQQSQNIYSTQQDTASISLPQTNPMPNPVSSSDSTIVKESVLLPPKIMSTGSAEVSCLQSPPLQYEEIVISCLDQESTNLSSLIDDNPQSLVNLYSKDINDIYDCNIDNEFLNKIEITNNQFSNIDYPSSSPIDIDESNVRWPEFELSVPDWSEIERLNLQNNINNKIEANNSPFSPIQAKLDDSHTSSPGFGKSIIDYLCIPPDEVSTTSSDSDSHQL